MVAYVLRIRSQEIAPRVCVYPSKDFAVKFAYSQSVRRLLHSQSRFQVCNIRSAVVNYYPCISLCNISCGQVKGFQFTNPPSKDTTIMINYRQKSLVKEIDNWFIRLSSGCVRFA